MPLQTASTTSAPIARPSRVAQTDNAVPYYEVVTNNPTPAPTPASVPVAAPPLVSEPITQPMTVVAAPVITAPTLTGHWVQAASYGDQASAHRFADRLGDRAQVQPFEVNGQTLYRILIGPWSDENAAEKARQAVVARGYREALLISGG